MNEESDLRIYVDVLMRHWRWIVAVTVVAAAAGLVVSLVSPVNYEATATVLVTNPLGEFRLSPGTENAQSSQPPLAGKAALELATTDALLQQVLANVSDQLPPDQRNLFSLRKKLEAKTGRDISVINLRATAPSAALAALTANKWADLYVQRVNELYGKSPDQSQFYAEQTARAKSDMERADQALVDFQKGSELAVLEAQLSAKQKALGDYLAMNESLILLQQDVQDLQDQLARRPAGAPSSLGDDLAQLMLQVNILSARSGELPVQLQLPSTGSLSSRSVEQQAAYLADLGETVDSRRAEAKRQTEALLPEIKALQGQIELVRMGAARLTGERDLAQRVYAALALKARETSITAQVASGSVRLAGSAAAPDRPISRNLLRNTILALAIGLLASCGAAFAIDYLRAPPVAANLRTEHNPALQGKTEGTART